MGLKQKIRGSQGEKLAKRGNEITAVMLKRTTKNLEALLAKSKIFPSFFETGS